MSWIAGLPADVWWAIGYALTARDCAALAVATGYRHPKVLQRLEYFRRGLARERNGVGIWTEHPIDYEARAACWAAMRETDAYLWLWGPPATGKYVSATDASQWALWHYHDERGCRYFYELHLDRLVVLADRPPPPGHQVALPMLGQLALAMLQGQVRRPRWTILEFKRRVS